ncbi:MAG: nucleotidyltransferase family protein [Bacteroidia bacterium]|nr:nucleotidyltransferase family protein [Bacteroidia bacterium]
MNSTLDIRDEEILLLGLCRLSFDIELTVMLRALAETATDWSYFSSLANKHGVAALVYHNLEKLGFLQYVPKEQAGILHNSLLITVSRNARNAEATSGVLNLLKEENIKIVLLKGLALELSVYGNKGLRQMTDVDVLASTEDCMKARKVLIDNGFTSLPVKSILHKPMLAYTGKHLPTLTKDGFAFELHHELFGAGRNVLTKMLYDASLETGLNSAKTYIPRPQIFFLYLVKHLYLHEMNNESQLRLYTDLVVLIEKHRDEIINYDLLTYAIQAGMEEILAWRLEPLRDLWGISFPGWLNDFINKWYNPASINKFVFFLKSPKDNPVQNRALVYRNTFKDIPGIHRKALYLLGDLFPTFEFMKKRYNCSSSWKALLYYPLRWGKMWYLIKVQSRLR